MHWQFGGNLEPVQMICEMDWKECPNAIGNYIWSEIVTDVLDCLRNESTVWRVMAALLVCILLLRIIYSKTKSSGDIKVDGDIFNKVGYKVEDLELKVNILTYKLQYGCWPMPHQVQKSNFRKNLRNLRLTLSNPNDRNNWIKSVLLSPGRNEPYASYSKYSPSKYRVTELFDAKKRDQISPYLQQENLSMRHRSKSSTKSSSDKSLKLSTMSKNVQQTHGDVSSEENYEVKHRNAISVPLFTRKRLNKCRRKSGKRSKYIDDKAYAAYKNFTRTIDDCKRYLKQLHDSNNKLGLICSSSELSADSSMKTIVADSKPQRCIQAKYADNTNVNRKENKVNSKGREKYTAKERNFRKTSVNEQHNDLELSNALYPILKLIDKRLIPSNMNITFCADVFPEGSALNMPIPNYCERSKFLRTSQETLYQVKKKLESLHNVLRLYELESKVERNKMNIQYQNNNEISNCCQNDVDILVPVTKEAENWNKGRTGKLHFNDTRNASKTIQQPTSNSSEEYESDETYRSSVVSIQNYSEMFNKNCCKNSAGCANGSAGKIPQLKISGVNTDQFELIQNNKMEYSSIVNYEKMPGRIYYSISSESCVEKDVHKEATVLPNIYVEDNHAKSFGSSDPYPVPMETDEDVISLKSSRTEISKDSELEDKPTAVLLQEALQFKKALLTRVELENVYYIDHQGKELHNESTSSHGSYVNNNLQSKLLDIISEEQSISSSTEKTSRTYMYLNMKQGSQYNQNAINFCEQNKVNKVTVLNTQNGYLDSKQNLTSPSEYFSFCDINQEVNNIGNHQLSPSKHHTFQKKESAEAIPNSLEVKYVNDILDKSCENLLFSSCMDTTESNFDEKEYMLQKQSFKEHFSRMNSINEFIYRSINSVELFSQTLNESILEDEIADVPNRHDVSSYVNYESLQQYANETCQPAENTADALNAKSSESDDNNYTEDQETTTHFPNLILKRNPGACSLIEQTQNVNTNQFDDKIENDPIYELSPCESKETSLDTNLIQDSLTSSINNSNDSNIPEPPSVTLLLNKSLDEDKLDVNWANVNNNSSYDFIGKSNRKTLSTNTIILSQFHATDLQNSKDKENNCKTNENLSDKKNKSLEENSIKHPNNERLDNEMDYCKSFPSLLSPHSSMYFTDEAPSSITKLNNVHSKNLERVHSKLCTKNDEANQVCEKDTKSRDTMNTERQSIAVPNETKEEINTFTETSPVKVLIPEFDTKQSTECYNNTNYRSNPSPSEASTDNPNATPRNHKDYYKNSIEIINSNPTTPRNKNNNDNSLIADNTTSDRAQANSPTNRTERFSMQQCAVWSNMSPREYSPRDQKKINAPKKMNPTVKSRSQENYTLKPEKLKRENTLHNMKSLKSDTISTRQNKRENYPNLIRIKQRNLSAEPIRNRENTVKLEKKRSRSQICFRTHESPKDITLQSQEFSSDVVPVDYIQLTESKSKLANHLKALSITSKTSSRSCIPILKSRLEAAKKSENEPRPKSPMRGPLTMTMFCSDNLCDKDKNVANDMQVEGKLKNNLYEENVKDSLESTGNNHKQDLTKKSYTMHQDDPIGIDITDPEKMVIYVNIFTKYDHNTTKIVDPNKFLKYIRNRNDAKDVNLQDVSTENEKNGSKIVTVVSSIINGSHLNQTTSTDLPFLGTQNDSAANILLNGRLKNVCFLSVEHREIDVTAKPSVIDTSTSISDLNNVTDQPDNMLSKFQICGTPEELESEEYIALLELLHQESNVIHLQELQSVCTELVSRHQNSK